MTMAYRRHSGTSSNWNRNTAFPSRTSATLLSPSFNHRVLPNYPSSATAIIPKPPSSTASTHSEQMRLYQSASEAMRPPSIPTVSEDPRENVEANPIVEESMHENTDRADILAKGKDREVVRTRPIFHANLEEAKKYHQIRLRTSASEKIFISCEEILCRYCDHFQFQLPVLESDRFKEGGRKRVLLRIKRRLVGIGEGQTTFQAMLAAYDDAVLYLFNDSKLHNQLLRPNEVIEWHHKKATKT